MTTSPSLALVFFPLCLLLSFSVSPVSAASTVTRVPIEGDRFPARTQSTNFAWGGAIWVAGGYDFSGSRDLTDVWGSYDFGRTWTQPVNASGDVVPLPGPCAADNSQAVVYAGAVYLFCSDGASGHQLGTMTSSSLTLTSWTGPTFDSGSYFGL